MWESRRNWGARCKPMPSSERFRDTTDFDANRGWRGSAGERWCSLRGQSKRDWYSLHIGKSNGKPRLISHIKVNHGVDGGGYPTGFKLQTKAASGSNWEYSQEHQGPIDVALPIPLKVTDIWFEITEPRKLADGVLDVWAIYDIEITEVRLLGKYWRTVIR